MNANNEIQKLEKIILKLAEEVQEQIQRDSDDEVDETTTTASADGYQTPFAFSNNRKQDKKKKDQIIKAGGYMRVDEWNKQDNKSYWEQEVHDDLIKKVNSKFRSRNKDIVVVIPTFGDDVFTTLRISNVADSKLKGEITKFIISHLKGLGVKRISRNGGDQISFATSQLWESTIHESVDYFEEYDKLPPKIRKLLDAMLDDSEGANMDYRMIKKHLKKFEKAGWTFDYGLDGEPYDLHPMNESTINEMGSYAEVKKKASELIKQLKSTEAELKKNPKDSKLKSKVADLKKQLVRVAHDVKSAKKNESYNVVGRKKRYSFAVSKDNRKGEKKKNEVENEDELNESRDIMWDDEDVIGRMGYYTDFGEKGVGAFSIKGWGASDASLSVLDSFDKKLVNHIPLKSDERIFRYQTRASKIGDMRPLVKINIKKGLVYFLTIDSFEGEIPDVEFDRKGYPVRYLRLRKSKINESVTEANINSIDIEKLVNAEKKGNLDKSQFTKPYVITENYVPYQSEQDKKPTNRRVELRKGEGTPNQKLGVGIREVRKQLSEIEKFLRWYKEIKTESDMGSDQYWKRTQTHLMKIKERVVNIAKSIKELDN